MKLDFFAPDWKGLNWTDWVPLDAHHNLFRKKIPKLPGIYRVRPVNGSILAYIGQTGRSLRQRLNSLRRKLNENVMPFNDPHTAAPNLWCWVNDGIFFECSAAPVDLSFQELHAFEDMLLWRHRITTGESTMCNYGRFHPKYIKSGNRVSGFRGRKLEEGKSNLAGGPCSQPLNLHGLHGDKDWMTLTWSEPVPLTLKASQTIPDCMAVYKILDVASTALLYIGETTGLRKRIRNHARKSWKGFISYHILPGHTPRYQRHEIESDLLGAYYETTKTPPTYQYQR